MSVKSIIKRAVFCLGLALALSPATLAGGFQLAVEAPSAEKGKDAVLVVQTFGCMRPADATINATAEGLVNGERRTVPLTLTAADTGVYTIKRQWPSAGFWVILINGNYNGMTSSLLVDLGPNGDVHPNTKLTAGNNKGAHVRGSHRRWAAMDVESRLKELASGASRASEESQDSRSHRTTLFAAGTGALLLIGFVALKRSLWSAR